MDLLQDEGERSFVKMSDLTRYAPVKIAIRGLKTPPHALQAPTNRNRGRRPPWPHDRIIVAVLSGIVPAAAYGRLTFTGADSDGKRAPGGDKSRRSVEAYADIFCCYRVLSRFIFGGKPCLFTNT